MFDLLKIKISLNLMYVHVQRIVRPKKIRDYKHRKSFYTLLPRASDDCKRNRISLVRRHARLTTTRGSICSGGLIVPPAVNEPNGTSGSETTLSHGDALNFRFCRT